MASFSTTTGQVDARLELGLEVSSRQARLGANSTDGARLVDEAGRADADRLDRRGRARSSVDQLRRSRASMASRVGGRATRRASSSRIVPSLVDDAAGDLGAADVDPDRPGSSVVLPGSSSSARSIVVEVDLLDAGAARGSRHGGRQQPGGGLHQRARRRGQVRAHLRAGLPHDVDHLADRAVAALLAAGREVLVDVVRRGRATWPASRGRRRSARCRWSARPVRERAEQLGGLLADAADGLVRAVGPSGSSERRRARRASLGRSTNRTCSAPSSTRAPATECRASAAGSASSRR